MGAVKNDDVTCDKAVTFSRMWPTSVRFKAAKSSEEKQYLKDEQVETSTNRRDINVSGGIKCRR